MLQSSLPQCFHFQMTKEILPLNLTRALRRWMRLTLHLKPPAESRAKRQTRARVKLRAKIVLIRKRQIPLNVALMSLNLPALPLRRLTRTRRLPAAIKGRRMWGHCTLLAMLLKTFARAPLRGNLIV